MGIRPKGKYNHWVPTSNSLQPNGNPDPKNFKILGEILVSNTYLILKVKYPDATNFEGVKIMVYAGFRHSDDLLAASKKALDPHFNKDSISPIARFAPTEEGMSMAIKFAMAMGE